MSRNGSIVALLALVLTSIAGCDGDSGPGSVPEAVVVDSAGIRIVTSRLPQEPLSEYATVSSEPTLVVPRPQVDVPDWGEVRVHDAVTLSDGRVAVADAGSLRLRFHRGDSTVATLGGGGVGRGRFLQMAGVGRADGDTLWVADPRSGDLVVVGPGAAEERAEPFPLPATAVGRFGGGSFLIVAADTATAEDQDLGVRRDTARYLRWWPATGDTAAVGLFPGSELLTLERASGETLTLTPPLGRSTSVAVGPGRFYVGDQERFEIRGYDPDGALREIVRVQGMDRSVTQETLSTYYLVDESGQQPEWAEEFWSHAPDTRPAFGHLLLDALGNLWVSEYVVTREPPRTWMVFSPEGALLGRVDVPQDLTLLEIGVDHLLGVVESSQEVRRHALERRRR